MRIKQQISEFYRFVHLGETFLYRLYKYSVHIETKKTVEKRRNGCLRRSLVLWILFCTCQSPSGRIRWWYDRCATAHEFPISDPSSTPATCTRKKNLFHRIHRETMLHIVWWSVNEFLPICCSHLRRLEYLHRTVIRSTKMSKQAPNGFRQWTRKRECSHKRRRDTTASKVIRDSRYCPLYSLHNNNNNNNSRLTALFRDYPSEPVP